MNEAPPRSFQRAVVPLFFAVSAAIACRKAAPDDERPVAEQPASPATDQSRVVEQAPRVLPARCPKGVGRFVALGDAGSEDLELGAGIPYAGGYAVGFSRRVGNARRAAVVFLGPGPWGAARVVELGPVLVDAPAPLLARRTGDLLVATFVAPPRELHSAEHRSVAVYALSSDAGPSLLNAVGQADDSAVTDIASDGSGVFVVWDEASAAGRGIIRGVRVGHQDSAAVRLSPAESDAEQPRLVAGGVGYTLLWIARSPEQTASADASEVPGDERAFGWLQSVELGTVGQVLGPARDLTPRDGHVSAYDARRLSDQTLLVVARDDGEAADGSGGSLLRVRVHGSTIEPPRKLPVDSVGRGAPSFVEGQPPWLSWTGHDEVQRVLPLDETGSASGLASAEDSMNDARPLATGASVSGASLSWLIATPTDAAGPFRVVECVSAKASSKGGADGLPSDAPFD
jgi:hypothetical protein